VAHACNPSYLGGGDQEDQNSRPIQTKSWPDSSQQISLVLITPVIKATWLAEIRRIAVRRKPRQIVRETLSQKKLFTIKGGLVEWLKV
jgi:hypothetical protein